MQDQNLIVHNLNERRTTRDGAEADAEIYDRIYRAIVEQRLPPGTKLGEETLCEVFHVSRTRIRRVLLSLSNKNIVELRPNRGAFVARPTAKEARHVFEARRSIEATIIRRAAERMAPGQARELRDLVTRERRAQDNDERRPAISLSGDFHLRLAMISGNLVLKGFLEELVSRSSLIIGLYGSAHEPNCSHDEHGDIVEALARGDGEEACRLMELHLVHIERGLRLGDGGSGQVDLKAIFAEDDIAG